MCSTVKWHMNGFVTYGLVCVKAIEVQVFLCTSLPSLALPLTMQYGTPILRHRAGKNTTSYKWQIKSIKNQQQTPPTHIKTEAKTILEKKKKVTEMLDALSGCCSGLKSSFLIFSLNSGEEIHYIIADNHVGHSVEKKNSWGEHTSMGSTSWAITTSCAFLLSTSVVTVFTPEKQQECQLKKIKSSTGSQLGGFNQILQGPNDLKYYSLKGKTTTH